jgi:hypothetical protein
VAVHFFCLHRINLSEATDLLLILIILEKLQTAFSTSAPSFLQTTGFLNNLVTLLRHFAIFKPSMPYTNIVDEVEVFLEQIEVKIQIR